MPRKGAVPTVASPRRNSKSGGRPNGAPPPEAPANGNSEHVSVQLEAITLEDGTQVRAGITNRLCCRASFAEQLGTARTWLTRLSRVLQQIQTPVMV